MKSKIHAERPFRKLSGLIPKSIIRIFDRKLRHAGIREHTAVWIGKRFLVSLLLGMIFLLLYLIIYNPLYSPLTFSIALNMWVIGFLAGLSWYYLLLYFQIADRTSEVEKVLPDFLLLTVSNLRAGMPPFTAFVHAARPQFGALYEEVKFSTAKAGGTASLVDALNEISDYFDSQVLKRTVNLFTKGIKSGGQLSKLLNASADEIRRIRDLRAELNTSTRTYTIFLGFIIIIIMPFLLSVSTQFVTIFLALQPEETNLDIENMANIPSFSGKILITPEEMVAVSIGTLLVTSLFVSGLAGIISKGKALYGVKYFPVFALASIVAFIIARMFIGGIFASFALT